jgi:hypothetical protein
VSAVAARISAAAGAIWPRQAGRTAKRPISAMRLRLMKSLMSRPGSSISKPYLA